jgi:hypothetical protein
VQSAKVGREVRRCSGGTDTDNSNILFIIIKIELEHADVVADARSELRSVKRALRAEVGEVGEVDEVTGLLIPASQCREREVGEVVDAVMSVK